MVETISAVKHLRRGHAEEYVRTLDSIGQRAGHVLAVGDLGHLLLCRIQTLIALADDAEALNHRDVLDAEEHQELGNGDSSRAAAVDDHLDLIDLATGQAAGVEQRRAAADSRAVLVIVEYRNVADLLESALDLKAARSRDVLQVDAAERAGDQLNGADDLVHILGSHAQRERIHVSERLEQRALALHNRHAGDPDRYRPDRAPQCRP